MKNVLRSLMFVAILGSFGDYCVAAQAAQPLHLNLKFRNGELRSRFEALQAVPLAQQDQATIQKIKQDSDAYIQEAQSNTNRNTKRLVEELNAEIMKQWPEPKKPGVFSRAGSWFRSAASSAAQKTKNVAGAGLSTLGNGVTSTASKAWSGLNYRLFEKGEITRAQSNLEARRENLEKQQHPNAQEIQQLLNDIDALQKRATTWYNQPHMPIEELRVKVQSLAIPAPRTRVSQSRENVRELEQQDIFTVGQVPADPAPLRIVVTDENGHSAHYKEPRNPAASAHDAGHAQPEPQAREITPPTAEEQKKQAEEIAAQAERERSQKESQEIPSTATVSSAASSSSASVAVSEAAEDVLDTERIALREDVAEKRDLSKKEAASVAPAPRITPATARAVSAAPQPQPAHPARTERSEALLKYLEALHEIDPHQQRKALHQGIIRYLEDQPAILNGITKCISDKRHLPDNRIKQVLRENNEYQELERNYLSRYSGNPNLNAVRQEFIAAAINSQKNFVAHPPLRSSKTNWWFRGVGAAAATYGAYSLYNLYTGTTKAMVGYNNMSWLGSLLPKAYSLTKAATFKVILPAVGIAAAGVICYACYRLYVHKKLSDAVTAAKAQCENSERTPQDREHLLQLTHQNLKESNKTMEAALDAGEFVGAVRGTNPIADAVQGALN